MTTATSFSERPDSTFRGKFSGVFLAALKKCRSLSIFYWVLSLVVFPLMYYLSIAALPEVPAEYSYFPLTGYSEIYSLFTLFLFTPLVCVMPIVFGCQMFSYLHNKRAVDVYHALPVSRSTLFCGNTAAGLVAVNAPIAVDFLLVEVIALLNRSALGQHYHPAAILADLLGWMTVASAVFMVTVLVNAVMGTMFDSAVFALGLCGMVPVLLLLTRWMLETLLVGYVAEGKLMDFSYMIFYSPFTVLFPRLTSGREVSGEALEFLRNSHIALAVWALAAAGLFFWARWLYRRRPSELAERTNMPTFLNTLMKYVVSYAGGVIFGELFFYMLDMGKGFFVLGAVLGSAMGFAVLEVITARGLRSFPRAFRPMAIMVILLGSAAAVLSSGGFGYSTRVPDDAVKVEILDYDGEYEVLTWSEYGWDYSTRGLSLETPEAVALAEEFHRAILQNLDPWEYEHGAGWEDSLQFSPTFRYTLPDGKEVSRYFQQPSREAAGGAFQKLLMSEEVLRETHPAFLVTAGQVESMIFSDRLGFSREEVSLTEEQEQAILDAMGRDLLSMSQEEYFNPGRDYGYVYLILEDRVLTPGERYPTRTNIVLTSAYRETMALLERYGLGEMFDVTAEDVSEAAVGDYVTYAEGNGFFFSGGQDIGAEWYFTEGREDLGWAFTDDEEEIRQLLDAGRLRMPAGEEPCVEVVFRSRDDGMTSSLMVPWEDIPAGIQAEKERQSDSEQAVIAQAAADSDVAVSDVLVMTN